MGKLGQALQRRVLCARAVGERLPGQQTLLPLPALFTDRCPFVGPSKAACKMASWEAGLTGGLLWPSRLTTPPTLAPYLCGVAVPLPKAEGQQALQGAVELHHWRGKEKGTEVWITVARLQLCGLWFFSPSQLQQREGNWALPSRKGSCCSGEPLV